MTIIKNLQKQLQFLPKAHLTIFSALLLLLILSQCMQSEQPIRKRVKLDLHQRVIKNDASSAITTPIEIEDLLQRHIQTVKSGDSLSSIFSRQDVSSTVLHQLMSSAEHADDLLKIHPGKEFHFGFDENDTLQELVYIHSKISRIVVTRTSDDTFSSENIVRQADIRLVYRRAIIKEIFTIAGEAAGIPLRISIKVAGILSGVVDPVYDTRPGDSFDVLYEEHYLDGERISIGKVLAASYTNSEETFTALRYEFEDGRSSYYNLEGISMQKPFLRTPLDSFRVSSNFNLRRRHPIHKKIRAHRGIDYAAPRGTPIFSVADGRVKRSGFSKANGNYVFISHPGGYETKYLHLHKRYVKTGQRVKQRTTIGTLGSTGYSTGPHLHYEFLVNGVHRNPKTIFRKLPTAKPIPDEQRQRFLAQSLQIQLQYENHQQAYLAENGY